MQIEILRTNGERETITVPSGRAAFAEIEKMIGASTLDTVNLRDGRVMLVDDAGWETRTVEHAPGQVEFIPTVPRKPFNPEATKLYHSVCRPGTTHQIVGDVAIAWDRDFA